MSVPLFLGASLLSNLDRVLVFVVVAKKSVDAESVFKTHWKGFSLIGEVHEDIFFGSFGELDEVSLELLWLRLFDTLWNDDLTLLEFLFLHVDRIIF